MSNSQRFNPFDPCYPSKEEAMAFSGAEGLPLGMVVIGTTYPIADYGILRENSEVFNFEYVTDGHGEVLVGGKWVSVSAGDTYILRTDERHEYRSLPQDPWTKKWIMFDCSYMSAFLDAYGVPSGVYRADTQSYFDTLISLSHSDAPFREICFSLSDCLHRIVECVASAAHNDARSDALAIRETLSAAVYRKCSLDDIADELHISKSTLMRTFKNEFSVSPYEYLLEAKTEAAKLLLKNTRMTLKEIADRLCLGDEHYFSSLFLRRTGIRPGAYRKTR